MTLRNALLSALLAAVIAPWSVASYAKSYDVLELPAAETNQAAETLIYAIRQFGDRYFATGVYGHILYSDDAGKTWTQAKVPVRSSITEIYFPTPELGWAVGHEAVILHSSDGGKTWVKQFDGHQYGQQGLEYYTKLAEQDPNEPWYPYLVDEMNFALEQGADKPFFKVYFLDEKRGYAVGAYGMVMATLDGGESWVHRLETIENDSFYHIFDFAPLPGEKKFFLAGEAGLFLVADVSGPYEERHARRVHSVPWEGSFFTSLATADGSIVVGGLRGQMFRTSDAGDTWTVVEKPPTSSIVDSVTLADGRLIFVGMAGEILASTDDGDSFTKLPVTSGDRIYAVAEGTAGTLLVGGPGGIKQVSLPQ
jgi:photosystem II stability/assembly factor-like uncharacterized protein